MTWFPRDKSSVTPAGGPSSEQTLSEINESVNVIEGVVTTPSPLPVGGATEATQQLNQAALGTEGGGVANPPPGGGTGIMGWVRNVFELLWSMRSIVPGKPAIDVRVLDVPQVRVSNGLLDAQVINHGGHLALKVYLVNAGASTGYSEVLPAVLTHTILASTHLMTTVTSATFIMPDTTEASVAYTIDGLYNVVIDSNVLLTGITVNLLS